MADTNYLLTYGDQSMVEDVREEIELISSMEDGLLNLLPKTTASNTVHSVMTDSLATPASAAVAEGADATIGASQTPSRVTNLTEIISHTFSVSGTQRAVDHYGYQDAYAYQKVKKMKDWAQSAEFDLVRSTLVSGVSGTAPKMAGIIAGITTNATAHTSGTTFSESIMNGLFELNWTNSNGEVATDIFVGSHMKRKISTFTGRSTSQVVLKDTASAVNTVDFYTSDFGDHRVHLHRLVDISGTDATSRFLAIRPEKWAIAYLRTPVSQDLAKLGDSDRGQIIGELTLENRNEACSVYANGFNRSL